MSAEMSWLNNSYRQAGVEGVTMPSSASSHLVQSKCLSVAAPRRPHSQAAEEMNQAHCLCSGMRV